MRAARRGSEKLLTVAAGNKKLTHMSAPSDPTGCDGLSWSYDTLGNRTAQNATSGTCPTFSEGVNSSNQLIGPPYQYNADVDLTNDGNHTYTYDAENRITDVDGGATASYVYNALGERVQRNTSSGAFFYIRNLEGRTVAMVGPGGGVWRDEFYVGSRHLVTYARGTTFFSFADWLGTESVRTDLSGAVAETMEGLPYGQSLDWSAPDITPLHFTGETMENTRLYDFGARYYNPAVGRFMGPDPLGGDVLNPQSLNRYSYVLNNPETFVDQQGLDCQGASTIVVTPKGATGTYNVSCPLPADYLFFLSEAIGPNAGGILWWTPPPPPDAFLATLEQKYRQGAQNTPKHSPQSQAPTSQPKIGPAPKTPYVPPLRVNCCVCRDGTGAGGTLYDICMDFPNFPSKEWAYCVRGKLLSQYVPDGARSTCPSICSGTTRRTSQLARFADPEARICAK